jgi:phosphopantothenoylcysteine decarboxylase/phosphopantothenate--cysteine ligase
MKKRCLITAGPTREHLDPVRFLTNPSSGKMGYALAAACLEHDWDVELISGPVSFKAPDGVKLTPITSGDDLLQACLRLFPTCDLLIMCAAVVDMRPAERFAKKQKKEQIRMDVRFEPVPDILRQLGQQRQPGQTLVGFAAETHDLEHYAKGKLENKRLDWMVANQVGGPDSAFESDSNRVTLYSRTGITRGIGPAPKMEIARAILQTLSENPLPPYPLHA